MDGGGHTAYEVVRSCSKAAAMAMGAVYKPEHIHSGLPSFSP